ncbi:MAG: hypothetical protein EOP22_20100 [Hyphomicrobiales bacterium]|nr:MAG: hypothetical protein EOP22_20100 [Hyphomicrobiales bacterium]
MPPIKSVAVKPKRARAAAAAPADEPAFSLGPPPALARPARRTVPAPAHRYQIGEKLNMIGGGNATQRAASGCTIVARLPYEGRGALLYRVRSDRESFERIVPEVDLTR